MITESMLSGSWSSSGVMELSSFSRIFCFSRFSVLMLSLQSVICTWEITIEGLPTNSH